MEKQTIINAIAVLSGTLGAMTGANNKAGAEKVAHKILELIEQL